MSGAAECGGPEGVSMGLPTEVNEMFWSLQYSPFLVIA